MSINGKNVAKCFHNGVTNQAYHDLCIIGILYIHFIYIYIYCIYIYIYIYMYYALESFCQNFEVISSCLNIYNIYI